MMKIKKFAFLLFLLGGILALPLFAQNEKIVKLYKLQKYEDCIEMADKLISKGDRNNWNYMYKAMSLSMLSKNTEYLKRNKLCTEQAVDILQSIFKKPEGAKFLESANAEATVVKQNAMDMAEVYANSKNEKKAAALYADLVKIFPTPDVQLAHARMNIVIGKDPNMDALKILLNDMVKYTPEEIAKWGVSDEYFIKLAQLVRDKSDYSAQWETLLQSYTLSKDKNKISEEMYAILQNLSSPNSADAMRAHKAWERSGEARYFDMKWLLAEKTLDNITAADTLMPVGNWFSNWTKSDGEPEKHFDKGIQMLCTLIDKGHPLSVIFAETLMSSFSAHFVIPFSENITEKDIFPYFRKAGITPGKNTENALLKISGTYKTYLVEIEKNLRIKNFSQCFYFIQAARSKFEGAQRLTELYKQAIIQDYITNYRGSEVSDKELGWTGNIDKCSAGTVSKIAATKLQQRLNYFRRLAGVPDVTVIDAELSAKCQKAALIMAAGYTLTHTPDAGMLCYTADGAAAARNSNLSLGYHTTEALMGQMRDNGVHNYSVGHRRWILNPYNKKFGHGSTKNSMALWVLPSTESTYAYSEVQKYRQQYVAWPPSGFCPVDLIFDRWSFSLSSADFKNAKVEMWIDGVALNVSIQKLEGGIGLNTIVWQHQSKITEGMAIEIHISNVVFEYDTKNPQAYTYQVFPIKIN